MSYQNRTLNSSLRHPSIGGSQANAGQSPFLLGRINEKKAELENLQQLRDLSGGLAAQMQALQEKLSTLSDGTEAVATVLSNWHNVMRAINMASTKVPKPSENNAEALHPELQTPLPQTLVRVPIEHQTESLQAQDSQNSSS
ncbi:MAG: hypothetical protein Q9217_006527 [Psora testacea]